MQNSQSPSRTRKVGQDNSIGNARQWETIPAKVSMHIPVEIAQGGQETQIDDETNEAPCADEEGAEIEVKLGVDLINYTYQGKP